MHKTKPNETKVWLLHLVPVHLAARKQTGPMLTAHRTCMKLEVY